MRTHQYGSARIEYPVLTATQFPHRQEKGYTDAALYLAIRVLSYDAISFYHFERIFATL